MSTERIRLMVAYAGGNFCGWQSQANGEGVQDHLERAFAKVLGQPRRVHGAGRTDTGVHALGMIAHTDVPKGRLPMAKWALALNCWLAPGVRVLRVTRARPDFHARFDAAGKIYVYRVWNHGALHPLEIGRAWHVPGAIETGFLHECAALFQGRHDFASFAANRGQIEPDTVRTVHEVTVARRGPLLTLRFRGEGFLYRMVRMMAGTMVRGAQGRFALTWVQELLERRAGRKSHYCAPPQGLYLHRVLYARSPRAGSGEPPC